MTGYGWSVYPTGTGFDVFDHYTKTVVTTTDTRKDAWAYVTAASKDVAVAA